MARQRQSMMIWCVIVMAMSVTMSACTKEEPFDDTWRPKAVEHDAVYRNDSLYMIYTVNEFIRLQFHVFHYFKTFKIPENETNIYVDSLVYSLDSLKMLTFVTIKAPRLEPDSIHKYKYTGYLFIGIRDSVCSPWKVYYFYSVLPGIAYTYKKMHENFRTLMFQYFKDQEELNPIVCPDTLYKQQFYAVQAQKYTMMKFGYNFGELEFWTEKNLLWRKNVRAKGHYNFETDHHQATTDQLLVYPVVVYPDSLILFYKQRCR